MGMGRSKDVEGGSQSHGDLESLFCLEGLVMAFYMADLFSPLPSVFLWSLHL